jgi:hypothetical protein
MFLTGTVIPTASKSKGYIIKPLLELLIKMSQNYPFSAIKCAILSYRKHNYNCNIR